MSEQIFDEKVEDAVRDAKKSREHISNQAFHEKAVEARKSVLPHTAQTAKRAVGSRTKHKKEIDEMKVILGEADEALTQYAQAFVQEDITPNQLGKLQWEALIHLGLSTGHALLLQERFPTTGRK